MFSLNFLLSSDRRFVYDEKKVALVALTKKKSTESEKKERAVCRVYNESDFPMVRG